jgi:hypothetical protein
LKAKKTQGMNFFNQGKKFFAGGRGGFDLSDLSKVYKFFDQLDKNDDGKIGEEGCYYL